jgi:hypothetical protein
MKSFDKIQIASDMFVEAHNRYMGAKQEIDYVVSILLSGAIIGIIGPLLNEQGGHSTHELLAKISNAISEGGDDAAHEGMFREIYNSLKHAGNKRRKIVASDDLEFKTDLKKETARMLDTAKDDFRNIEVSIEVRSHLSARFLELLQLEDGYA